MDTISTRQHQNDKPSRNFPFIVMTGLSSEDQGGGGGTSRNTSSDLSNPSFSSPTNNQHVSRSKQMQLQSGGDHKSKQQPRSADGVNRTQPTTKQISKKLSPFTNSSNNNSVTPESSANQPQKQAGRHKCLKIEKELHVSEGNKSAPEVVQAIQRQNKSELTCSNSQGDFRGKKKVIVVVEPDVNSDGSKQQKQKNGKYLPDNIPKYLSDNDWSVQEKFDQLFSTMRQREDEIFRLRAEISNLKETITKNTAETGASKFLYQTMQKQLDTIEEKIEQQDSGVGEVLTDLSRSCSETSIVDIDIDRLIKAIKQLNIRVEQGQSMELCYTSAGASFKRWDGVNLTIYSNGLLLAKDFMPFNSVRAKFFLQDILDGFFPNEFQSSYPQGVYIIVNDQRKVSFKDDSIAFNGQGYKLNQDSKLSESSLPQLVPGNHLTGLKQRQFSLEAPHKKTYPEDTKNESSNLSVKIRSELPTLEASYDVLLAKRILGLNDKLIVVKLRNIKNGRQYKMSASIFARISEVLQHLNRYIEEVVEPDEQCVLIHSLPMGVLSVPSATFSDYGIEKNTVLYFRVDKES